tara:strand:- start:230 stop:586 length:357 start_codon:yes stop_codon:yes gene_type:complete
VVVQEKDQVQVIVQVLLVVQVVHLYFLQSHLPVVEVVLTLKMVIDQVQEEMTEAPAAEAVAEVLAVLEQEILHQFLHLKVILVVTDTEVQNILEEAAVAEELQVKLHPVVQLVEAQVV